jgi:hypothetical protein
LPKFKIGQLSYLALRGGSPMGGGQIVLFESQKMYVWAKNHQYRIGQNASSRLLKRTCASIYVEAEEFSPY